MEAAWKLQLGLDSCRPTISLLWISETRWLWSDSTLICDVLIQTTDMDVSSSKASIFERIRYVYDCEKIDSPLLEFCVRSQR